MFRKKTMICGVAILLGNKFDLQPTRSDVKIGPVRAYQNRLQEFV